MFAGIFDLQKFKLRPHLIQLHRKILRLQRHLKDLPQIFRYIAEGGNPEPVTTAQQKSRQAVAKTAAIARDTRALRKVRSKPPSLKLRRAREGKSSRKVKR